MDNRTLVDWLDVGLAAIAPDWTIDEWTAPAARLTGIPAARVLGQNFWAAFPTAKGTHVEQVLQDVMGDGQPRQYVWPARAPELSGLVFETRVTRGPHNRLLLLFRQVREEIPPHSRAAQILTAFETERRLYYQLFNALPTPALIVSVDGQILEANPAALSLLSADNVPAVRGRNLAEWIGSPQRLRLRNAMRDALARPQRIRINLEPPGELQREVDGVVDSVDPGIAGGRLLFLAVDVSTEILLQRRLFQADRLAQLGALLAGVAHEVNNPLAAIAAFGETLHADAPNEDARQSAQIIHTEALRAGRMVQTLLDYARQRPRVCTTVDLADVVDRALALQRGAIKRARIETTVTIPDNVATVLGDPQEFQQVVLNAMVNAVQAIEGTGRPGGICISARRMDGFAVLTVEDSGPGVPAEILDRVFDPFFSTKGEQGTGLGLSISLGLVRGMGGRMWLENVEGGGARVVIEVPREGATALPGSPARGIAAARHLAVLLVEDDEAVRRGTAKMLERLGHVVTTAATYDEARMLLMDPSAPFQALVVDVHLDAAHTGFDLFEDLQVEGSGVERRIVFTTGDSVSVRTRDALAKSERPVLKKPFRLEELREMLDRVASQTAPPPHPA